MESPQKSALRRHFLVDASLQLAIPLKMCGTLLLLTGSFVAFFAWFGHDLLGEDSRGLARMAMVVVCVYLLVALTATFGVGVLVTQRVAGPVRVIERAVAAMRAGDFECRLKLRSRDHLTGLARELAAFRTELVEERARQERALADAAAALEQGRLDDVRAALDAAAAARTSGDAAETDAVRAA